MPFQSTATTSGLRRKASPPVESSQESSEEMLEQGPQNEDSVPLLDGNYPLSRPQRSSDSNNSVIVSSSVRALAALSGSPLPLSPGRVKAEAARRTSSIPRSRSRLQSPSNGVDSQKRYTYPSSTTRTVDLIEAFPSPPYAQIRTRNSAPARMSVFPIFAGLEDCGSNVLKQLPVGRKHVSVGSDSEQSIIRGINSARSPTASNAWLSGALPDPPECDGSGDTAACNSRPVRGEDVRYRHSGTPVYDVNTASLREMDQNDESVMAATLSHPGSPASGKTGATRYFSAVSQVGMSSRSAGTRTPAPVIPDVHARDRDGNRVQQERAVANGALMFFSQSQTTNANSGVHSPGREETTVPVTTTSHGRASLRRHGSFHTQKSPGCGVDGVYESNGSENEQSKRARHCLFCRARSFADRVSRLTMSKDQMRSIYKKRHSA